MRRFAFVVALTLIPGSSASAQPPRGPSRGGDDMKKLQDEVAKLQAQLKEMEARLAKATGEAKKEADKKDEGRNWQGGFGGFGPPFGRFPGRGSEPKKEADKKEADKKDEGRGRSPFERFDRGRGGRGGENRPAEKPEASKNADLEKKLDKLLEEVESLRREIRRR